MITMQKVSIAGARVSPNVGYYIDPISGNDANAGTWRAPWLTLGKANSTVVAGDTVVLKPGVHIGQISPANSGAAGAPITYTAMIRRATTIIENPTVDLRNLDYINIKGFILRPDTPNGRLVYCEACNNIIFEDNDFGQSRRTNPILFSGDAHSNIKFRLNLFYSHLANEDWTGSTDAGGAFVNTDAEIDGFIYEGNITNFVGVRHVGLSILNNDPQTNVVIRGSVFCGNGIPVAVYSAVNWLIEDCYFRGQLTAARAAAGNSLFFGTNGIIRRNYFVDIEGEGVDGYAYGSNNIIHQKVYQNLFYNSQRVAATWGTNSPATIANVAVKNNVWKDCDKFVGGVFVYWEASEASNIIFARNHTNQSAGLPTWSPGTPWTVGTGDAENPSNDPVWIDATVHDFRPDAGSPLLAGGRALTTANGSGSSSTSVVVYDSRYFTDGFGLTGERGDLIQIGSNDPVRIISVDSDTQITIETAKSWSDGDTIALAYSGAAPNAGPIDDDAGAVPHAFITATADTIDTGESITLTCHTAGPITPKYFEWFFSDGTKSCGSSVTKKFSLDYAFGGVNDQHQGVVCLVRDLDRSEHFATFAVRVRPERNASTPLVDLSPTSTNWPEDPSWWMFATEGIPETTRFVADGDNIVMELGYDIEGDDTRIFIRDWDTSLYPNIKLDVKAPAGVSVGVYVNDFASDILVRTVSGDGDWHETTTDVSEHGAVLRNIELRIESPISGDWMRVRRLQVTP